MARLQYTSFKNIFSVANAVMASLTLDIFEVDTKCLLVHAVFLITSLHLHTHTHTKNLHVIWSLLCIYCYESNSILLTH